MDDGRLDGAIAVLDAARAALESQVDDMRGGLDKRQAALGEVLDGLGFDSWSLATHKMTVPVVRSNLILMADRVQAAIERERQWLVNSRGRTGASVAGATNPRAPIIGEVGRGPVLPAVRGVEPDSLTSLFAEYGDASTDLSRWTGADSTYSMALPDGRVLWVFSDTFVGPIRRGQRLIDSELPSNTLVVQDGSELRTILGPPYRRHESTGPVVAPDDRLGPADVYWAGDAQLCDGVVEVMYRRYVTHGGSFAGTTAVARFDPANLDQPLSVDETPYGGEVAWGSAVRRADGRTYVYGAEDASDGKYLHVARSEGDSLFGQWEFLTSSGSWSSEAHSSARQLGGVSNEFSVSPVNGGYLLLTHDTTTPLSPDIVGYMGATPFGPFENKTLLYTTPETGVTGTFGSPRVYTHNAHAHPHIDRGSDGLLVSYNVHAWPAPDEARGSNGPELDRTDIFRPRFVTVRFDV